MSTSDASWRACPLRQWKLSPMDLESYGRYSKARDVMLKATDTKFAPWHIVRSDDKRRARLNCISHILKAIPAGKARRGRKLNCPSAPGPRFIYKMGTKKSGEVCAPLDKAACQRFQPHSKRKTTGRNNCSTSDQTYAARSSPKSAETLGISTGYHR